MLGGSKRKYFYQCINTKISSGFLSDQLSTINIQLSSVSDRSSRICGPACVFPNVGVVHVGDDQHAGPRSNHRGCDTWT